MSLESHTLLHLHPRTIRKPLQRPESTHLIIQLSNPLISHQVSSTRSMRHSCWRCHKTLKTSFSSIKNHMVIWSTRGTQRKGGQWIVMPSTTTAVAVKTTMEQIKPLGSMLSYMALNHQLIRVGFLPQ